MSCNVSLTTTAAPRCRVARSAASSRSSSAHAAVIGQARTACGALATPARFSAGISSRTAGARRQVTRMGLFGLGGPELLVIAGVGVLLFGPQKLPEIGKGLGKTVKSFQGAAKEFEEELKKEMADDDDDKKKEGDALPPSPAAPKKEE